MEWLTTLLQTFAKPFQWWVVVAPWERGLRIRLGKVVVHLTPGIHFRIPFLDRVHVQSVRLRTLLVTSQSFTTKDGQPVTVSFTVEFSIVDLRLMFDSLSAPDKTLMYRAAAAIGDFIGAHDKTEIAVPAMEASATNALASFGCGLGKIRVRLTTMAHARALRVILHEYGETSGLHNQFDQVGAFNS